MFLIFHNGNHIALNPAFYNWDEDVLRHWREAKEERSRTALVAMMHEYLVKRGDLTIQNKFVDIHIDGKCFTYVLHQEGTVVADA